MAFTLDQTDSYSWPVELEVAGDGGKFERHSFDIRFRRLTQSRMRSQKRDGPETRPTGILARN